MIPYVVGKLAPDSSHLTMGLVKYVAGGGCFRAVSSQNGDKYVTAPPPQSLNWSVREERDSQVAGKTSKKHSSPKTA